MTNQNRVDPFGTLHAVAARGQLMGNRGILHDDTQQIVRMYAHQNWVTCALSFKGRHRKIMQPGHYTELFFLDEATAFATPETKSSPTSGGAFTANPRPAAHFRRRSTGCCTRIASRAAGES